MASQFATGILREETGGVERSKQRGISHEYRSTQPCRNRPARRRGGLLCKSRHYRNADGRGPRPRTRNACRARIVRRRLHRRRRRVGPHDGEAGRHPAASRARTRQRARESAQCTACSHTHCQLDRRSPRSTPRIRRTAHLGHSGSRPQRGLDANRQVCRPNGRGQPCCGRGGTRAAGARGVTDSPCRLPVGTGT